MFIHLKIVLLFIFNLNSIITTETNNYNNISLTKTNNILNCEEKTNSNKKNSNLIILYNKKLKINEIGKYNKNQKQIIFVYESLNIKYPKKPIDIKKSDSFEKVNNLSKRLKSTFCFEGLS